MKVLLFLCVSAALVYVSVLDDGYHKLKAYKNHPPRNSEDYIYMIVTFSKDVLHNQLVTYRDPDMSETKGVTAFIDTNWHPPNPNLQTVRKNFSSPDAAMNSVNAFVKNQTSGNIDNLVGNVNENTAAVIVHTNNAWKIPSAGGTGWTKKLDGEYKKVEDKNLSLTVIELPHSHHISVLLAMPFPGKEEEVGRIFTAATIKALRKSMTYQLVTIDVPRTTLYTAYCMTLNKDYDEFITAMYSHQVKALFP